MRLKWTKRIDDFGLESWIARHGKYRIGVFECSRGYWFSIRKEDDSQVNISGSHLKSPHSAKLFVNRWLPFAMSDRTSCVDVTKGA